MLLFLAKYTCWKRANVSARNRIRYVFYKELLSIFKTIKQAQSKSQVSRTDQFFGLNNKNLKPKKKNINKKSNLPIFSIVKLV